MEIIEKLQVLGESALYDVCSSSCLSKSSNKRNQEFPGIFHSFYQNGRCVKLFRVLLTNACENDCFYCGNRSSRNMQRIRLLPEELTKAFFEFYKRKYVDGLFLSSGILKSPDYTMEEMLKSVEILRNKFKYNGYIHLKVLPGVSKSLVDRASILANRLSINMEAPNSMRLLRLSKEKNLKTHILERMYWIRDSLKKNRLSSGQTTQFVVGAAEESDLEILETVDWLYKNLYLKRVYFSPFSPVIDTPLEGKNAVSILRERRLYEADFLMRKYKFKLNELVFLKRDKNLPLDIDPKLAFAISNPHLYPVDINKAQEEELLRVPGIGPESVKKILSTRKRETIKSLDVLKTFGTVINRAKYFIIVNGKTHGSIEEVMKIKKKQTELWNEN